MKIRGLFISLSTVFLLFGCQSAMNNNENGQDMDRDQLIEPTRYEEDRALFDRTDRMSNTNNRDRLGRNNRSDRDFNRYEVSDKIAERITSELDEVDRAYVLTTNNNAYVAVVMDNDNRRTRNNTGTMNDGTNRPNFGTVSDGRRVDNNRNNPNRNENRRGTADMDGNRQGIAHMDENRRGTADNDLSRRTLTGRDDDINDRLKSRIADIVRDVDGNIDNVYVSTNPDFVDLTNNYIDDVNSGRPIEGFFDEMGNMIERIFPQNR